MATERAAHSVPVGDFQSEEECFDDWIKMFEDAVLLATNAPADRKEALYKKWLPLKLDKRTRDLLKNCTDAATWDALKKELKELLVDPQEKYNWQINKSSVQWDGKENFHSLANKIKRLVNLYHDGTEKDKEYFFRFRLSLPTDYRRAIDLGCDEKRRTLEEAKKMAFRFQMSQVDSTPAAHAGGGASGGSMSFTGAAMSDDRLTSMEMALESMNVRLGNHEAKLKKPSGRKSRHQSSSSDDGGNCERAPACRDRDDRYNRRDQYSRRDSSGERYQSRDSEHRDSGRRNDDRYRRESRDRDRRYSHDRRDHRRHRDRRDDYDSQDRKDRRHQKDNHHDGHDSASSDELDHDHESRSNRRGESANHHLAKFNLESCFRKYCSMVMESKEPTG